MKHRSHTGGRWTRLGCKPIETKLLKRAKTYSTLCTYILSQTQRDALYNSILLTFLSCTARTASAYITWTSVQGQMFKRHQTLLTQHIIRSEGDCYLQKVFTVMITECSWWLFNSPKAVKFIVLFHTIGHRSATISAKPTPTLSQWVTQWHCIATCQRGMVHM